MDLDIKAILKSAAPMLGAAIGGPFGGMAAKFAVEALGNPDAKPEDLPALLASATPEQIAAVKKADQDFQVRMRELGFDNEQKLAALAVDGVRRRRPGRRPSPTCRCGTPRLAGTACGPGRSPSPRRCSRGTPTPRPS